jgi:transcriptional regulator with XRE-family HTH domain
MGASHITADSALLREALNRSGLSQADLARRAGIPRSVLNAYLRGSREPGAEVFTKLIAAAGFDLQLSERKPAVDAKRAGEILVQVLGLAEALPFRPRGEMQFPPLKRRLEEQTA